MRSLFKGCTGTSYDYAVQQAGALFGRDWDNGWNSLADLENAYSASTVAIFCSGAMNQPSGIIFAMSFNPPKCMVCLSL